MAGLSINRDRLEWLARFMAMHYTTQGSPSPAPVTDLSREDIVRYAVVAHAIDYGLGSKRQRLHSIILEHARSGGLTALELSNIKREKLGDDIFRSAGIRVPDVDRRVMLLRDIGIKVSRIYGGEFYRLVVESRGQLVYKGYGFLELAEDFKAYRSPARSKPLRLAMELYSLGVLPSHDLWNADVVVDSSMLGLAIRSGVLELDGEMLERISAGVPLDPREDVVLRTTTAYAFRAASIEAGLDPFSATRVLRYIYERYCSPHEMAEECLASERPLLRVRDPLPPAGAWWD